MSIFARGLFLVVLPMAWAETTTVIVRAGAESDVSIRVTSPRSEPPSVQVLAAVVHCPGRMISDGELFGNFRCSHALTRDGLLLAGGVDLAPLARTLQPTDEIQLWLEYPHLGFETSSVALTDEGDGLHVVRVGRFGAGSIPGSIRIEFGYRSDQMPAIYFPLGAMALVLMLLAMAVSRGEHGELLSSVFMLGAIVWLGASQTLQAAEPLRILLSGTFLGNIAAAGVAYCLPLLSVAIGAALGNRKRPETFGEVFWGFGTFMFPMASALSAIPAMADGNWMGAAPWLVMAPGSVFLCRRMVRTNGGVSVRQVGAGELIDRVSQLAARAGRTGVRVFVSSSTRPQILNAYALLRSSILMTAPLIQSLTKREVDAVVAHELSHFGHTRRSSWAALAIAAVFSQTPLAGVFLNGPIGFLIVVLIPSIVFFSALHGARKREFAADASSVALTGDARAMISALAKIARRNKKPLGANRVTEWFSTHPSTERRIQALGALGRLQTAEIETLCSSDVTGERYSLPPDEGNTIFTLDWQNANAARYAWTAICGTSAAGLFVAGLMRNGGFPQFLAGIALACALTKLLASAVMAGGYARLKRKLAVKLGVKGQLVGLAVDGVPKVYNGFRFPDAGFLSFQGGRLCYQSERTMIRISPKDVVEVSMVPAAPAAWRRMQPLVRFRLPESGDLDAFILHPVEFGASPRSLLRSIERWRRTETSTERTSISGLHLVAGQPFQVPTIATTARSFRVPFLVTMVGSTLAGWVLRAEFWYALVFTACAYIFMFLPALLYRPSPMPPPLRAPAD
jgi:heat shock protein HtpX